MGTQQPIRKAVQPEIPDKLYFRIGDVARICEVPTYVLRFWETEFPQLKPNKGGTGQRLYRRRDVELALRIKTLLYDQGYTIPGARQVFKNEAALRSAAATAPAESSAVPEPGHVAAPHTEAEQPIATPTGEDAGAKLRAQAGLRELRGEMAALLQLLSKSPAPVDRTPAPAPRLQAMRPRLVLEPRPVPPPPSETASLAVVPRLRLAQRDLFMGKAGAQDETPKPPTAS